MTTTTQNIPTAIPAERAVIGAALVAPHVLPAIRAIITAGDFHEDRHATLFGVLCGMADADRAIDPITFGAELGKRDDILRLGGLAYVFTLIEQVTVAGNAPHHALEVRTASRRRQLIVHGERLAQIGTDVAVLDDAMMAAAHEWNHLGQLVDDQPDQPIHGLMTWREFVASRSRQDRWIVPGLIRRHDTIMILGGPGAGKSSLSRQVGMCLAAGVHPFTLERIEPVRTLVIDLENSPDQTADEAEPMLAGVDRFGDVADRGWIWAQPEGLNIRKAGDAALLERAIAKAEPDVLCMGSLKDAYRRGRDDWDTAALEVQDVLKRLRSRYNLGLWLEHHMPNAPGGGHTGTPYGGMLWASWPTHGRWMRKHPDAGPNLSMYLLEQSFRGDRGERALPLALTRGGKLPWTAYYDQAEVDMLAEASK